MGALNLGPAPVLPGLGGVYWVDKDARLGVHAKGPWFGS